MKKIQLALLAGIASMAMSSAALAEGGYFSFGGGFHLPQDSNITLRRPPTFVPTTNPVTFDTGYILAGALGYKWQSGLRTELELGYRKSTVNDFSGAGATGNQRVMGLMGNLLYDFGELGSINPYVGGGIGGASTKWNNVQSSRSATFPTGAPPILNDKSSAFQWQGIVGIVRRQRL